MRKDYSFKACNEESDFKVSITINHHELERKDWTFHLGIYGSKHDTVLTQDQAKSLRNFLNNYLPK